MTPSESERDVDDAAEVSPLGTALALLGDMWTLRIVMLVFSGRRRFQDIRTSLAISDPVLSRRLTVLIEHDILYTEEYQQNPPRKEYLLTESGRALWPILVALWVWDRRWAGHQHRDAHMHLRHLPCGHLTRPVFGCAVCGAIGVGIRDTTGQVDERLHVDTHQKRSRRSPSMTTPIDATGVLGDRWSTFLLSDAFTGSRRFNDFQTKLQISPVTLTQRLNLFVEGGLMSQDAIEGSKRTEYRLTPKALDFWEVTTTINHWAQQWVASDGRSGLSLTHTTCGAELVPQYTCNACNGVIERDQIRFEGAISDL
ncbi:winged helix-turn-helix transcriptional regulator [Pimelobacter simplex]|uniref:winged helix-turn-helix transcriptional regulator n=1 Tax=Nocardioides simplex TaxID=2045 RepID=UPI0020B125AC|nr:helix-turn-helix domain-containing protein [Pimelobacter simplex]